MGRLIYYNKKYYSTIKDFVEEFDLPYYSTVYKLNKGYTPEEIVQGIKKSDLATPQRNIQIEYDGIRYNSLLGFCKQHNLQYTHIRNLIKKGMTIKDIIEQEGINILFDNREYKNIEGTTSKDIGKQKEIGISGDDKRNEKDDVIPYEISNMPIGIRDIFMNNPYCVLGISCNTTNRNALRVRKKLEDLSLTGRESFYQSEYDLKNVEKPNRKIENIRRVTPNLYKLEYRWLWFLSPVRIADFSETRRYYKNGKVDFDAFLFHYIGAMVVDPDFFRTDLWGGIFEVINDIYSMTDIELQDLLHDRLNLKELDIQCKSAEEIQNSLKKTILEPIHKTLNEANGNAILNVFRLYKNTSGHFKVSLKKTVITASKTWTDRVLFYLTDTLESMSAIKSLKDANYEEARMIHGLLCDIEDNYLHIAQEISKTIFCEKPELIMEVFKKQFNEGAVVLAYGGMEKAACHYISLIYDYCSASEKIQILETYSFEWLEIADIKFTPEECDAIGYKYFEKHDMKKAFMWKMKAALKGYPPAQCSIGTYYATGWGCKKSEEEAVAWYRKAALNGDASAWGNLAYYYLHGNPPIFKDEIKAKECWIRAYRIEPRKYYTVRLDRFFPGWRSEPNELLKFPENIQLQELLPYVEDDIVEALYRYGVLLYKGINGCDINKEEGKEYILKAKKAGVKEAESFLNKYC